MTCRLVGSDGEATAANFVLPHLDDRVTVRSAGGERVERLGTRPSYDYQLEAFAAAVLDGAPLPHRPGRRRRRPWTLIDACYRAAGLRAAPAKRVPSWPDSVRCGRQPDRDAEQHHAGDLLDPRLDARPAQPPAEPVDRRDVQPEPGEVEQREDRRQHQRLGAR